MPHVRMPQLRRSGSGASYGLPEHALLERHACSSGVVTLISAACPSISGEMLGMFVSSDNSTVFELGLRSLLRVVTMTVVSIGLSSS